MNVQSVQKVHKLNESFSYIDDKPECLMEMFEYLKVERPGVFFDPLVKAGLKSPFDYFSSIQQEKLLVMNGHLQLLRNFGINREELVSDFTEEDLKIFLQKISKIIPFEPYDFQVKSFIESLLNVKQINLMCTSSGKSLTIAMIAEFFRQINKKGILLVPNINLLTQFKDDIKEYNLHELYEDTHVIGGGSTERHFNNSLTISTWQSMMNFKHDLDKLDYVITDECHRFASEETAAIVKETINCKYKWGFTGTIPENPCAKMELIGLFGLPKKYITSSELIERGLGCPIKINTILLKYSKNDQSIFRKSGIYLQQLKFIKEHAKRSEIVVNLVTKIKETGNTLVLFQHTEHGKTIFIETMKKLYPDVLVENKNITGKKSFEFQEQYGVYFLNGEDDAKTREKTRKILEKNNDAILVANYALLSTGVSIKKLHNLVLASPLKSYTTVTQSIGRLMRLHHSKKEANIFDLVDCFPIFKKQYKHRLAVSYNSEEFPVREFEINLF